MILKAYQFAEPGDEAKGPLPVGTLAEMMQSGALSRDVMVLDGEEWKPLRDVLPPAGPVATIKIDRPRPEDAEPVVPASFPERESIGPVVRFLASLELLVGVILIVGSIALGSAGISVVLPVSAGVAALLSGVMTLAAAEVLERLKEIRDELRRR